MICAQNYVYLEGDRIKQLTIQFDIAHDGEYIISNWASSDAGAIAWLGPDFDPLPRPSNYNDISSSFLVNLLGQSFLDIDETFTSAFQQGLSAQW